jgi:hypothetical protein
MEQMVVQVLYHQLQAHQFNTQVEQVAAQMEHHLHQ